jgi:hypothetical protein
VLFANGSEEEKVQEGDPSGGKYIDNRTHRMGNPATQALRLSAQSIGAKSKGPALKIYNCIIFFAKIFFYSKKSCIFVAIIEKYKYKHSL